MEFLQTSQMSFRRETSGGGVAKCLLFSPALLLAIYDVQDCNGANPIGTLHHTQNNQVTWIKPLDPVNSAK